MKLSGKLSFVLLSVLLIIFGTTATVFSAAALSKFETEAILKAAGFFYRGNQVLNTCEEVADYKLNAVDLNGDGILEVFIQDFSGMCYGSTGGYLILLMKDSKGRWKKRFDLSASGYKFLSSRNKGFPDIETEGPGFCHGVWKWTGAKYEYKCSLEARPGGCSSEGVKSICK